VAKAAIIWAVSVLVTSIPVLNYAQLRALLITHLASTGSQELPDMQAQMTVLAIGGLFLSLPLLSLRLLNEPSQLLPSTLSSDMLRKDALVLLALSQIGYWGGESFVGYLSNYHFLHKWSATISLYLFVQDYFCSLLSLHRSRTIESTMALFARQARVRRVGSAE
jgi:hypothetical protein